MNTAPHNTRSCKPGLTAYLLAAAFGTALLHTGLAQQMIAASFTPAANKASRPGHADCLSQAKPRLIAHLLGAALGAALLRARLALPLPAALTSPGSHFTEPEPLLCSPRALPACQNLSLTSCG